MKRCLFCYQELKEAGDFHPSCSRKIFGKPEAPELPYGEEDMLVLAEKVIRSQVAVTGVQAKLSLSIQKPDQSVRPARFTIVGLWGDYILKPPAGRFPFLPEIEDLTMHLAELSKIKVVPHSLIKLKGGKPAYITKRIDRSKKGKVHMEDMCQLTERLTEFKYKGSYEQIGKAITKYSATPGFDLIAFYEQVLFCFLTGNADMHLKNFSLINDRGYHLSPAYDLLSSALVMGDLDEEELALTLNGKKRKIKRNDFTEAMKRSKLEDRMIMNIFSRFEGMPEKWNAFIDISFLPAEMKQNYKDLIRLKAEQLEML